MTAANYSLDELVLAPMEGVIDALMRHMLTSIGGYDRCVTEFVRVSQTVLPPRVFFRLCPELKTLGKTASGTPVYVQLLGSDPTLLAENAIVAHNLGAPGIDLNFGCPAKTVNKSKGGATLLKEPERIYQICSQVRRQVPSKTPITAKIRLGYDDTHMYRDILAALAASNLSGITIHARTKAQGYRPPAHWEHIAIAVETLAIPVIANGEMWSPTDVARCAEASGATRFMLGRGALCRPDLARAVHAYHSGTEHEGFAWLDVIALLQRFLDGNQLAYDARYAVNPVKQWLVYLQQYYPQAAALFQRVKRVTEAQDMATALELCRTDPALHTAA